VGVPRADPPSLESLQTPDDSERARLTFWWTWQQRCDCKGLTLLASFATQPRVALQQVLVRL